MKYAPSALALFTSLAVLGSALPAFGANAGLSGTDSVSYTEGASAVAVLPTIGVTGGPYDGSYIEFEIDPTGSNADNSEDLTIPEVAGLGSVDTTNGAVSVFDGKVYLGEGGSYTQIGQVSSTFDGQDGTKLRVEFVTSFANAGFESAPDDGTDYDQGGTLDGWSARAGQYRLGVDTVSIGGQSYTIPDPDGGYTTDYFKGCDPSNDDDAATSLTTSVKITSGTENVFGTVYNLFSEGSQSLELRSSGQSAGGGDIVHGPVVWSDSFTAEAGQTLYFDWAAFAGGDNYHIWAGLLNVTDSKWEEILDETGNSDRAAKDWAEAQVTIPESDEYRFVFVSGTQDWTCARGVGARLLIDNVRVVGSKALADPVQTLARQVRFATPGDNPPATHTLRVRAVPASGTTATRDFSINITPTNDAPSIDGDGDTTAVAKTVVELDANSADNPISNVTGTLTGYDPDEDSPTFTFGISGETASGDSVSKVGTYGTLTVTPSTGAYTYVPNMTAIKPLDTGDDPVDSFSLTVSDGSLSGSGTLNFTIDSVTDTEPSAPTITAVIPGDQHLSILFDAPDSIGGGAISDYEYSTDGTNFASLGSVPTGSFAITALSSDGTTALSNGVSYPVTIRATNGQYSPASNAVSGTPSGTPAISTPSIQSFDPNTAKTAIDNDFEISGFAATDDLLVSIGLIGQESGTQAALPNFEDSGATKGDGYDAYTDGDLFDDFALTGTQTQVNAALAGLQLKTGADRSNFSVNVSASIVSGDVVQSGSTQSFYEYVADSGITWTAARTAAETRTFAGVNGYLATITSASENAFVASRIPDADNVWIGASDAVLEGDWRWVTGPEGQNGGTRFWYSEDGVVNGVQKATSYSPPAQTEDCVATATEATLDGNPIRGSIDDNLVTYACWASNEPNNSTQEDAVVTNWSSSDGKWNDLPVNYSGSIGGYVVEYSEWNGQTFSASSVVKSASSVSMGGPVLSATSATGAVSLSWTVPTRSGQTVLSYAVTAVPSVSGTSACSGTATSCTVSGLTAGTQYSFTVVATWSDAVESTSNSASARAQAASGGGNSGGSDDDDDDSPAPVVSPSAGGGTPALLPRRAVTPPQTNLLVTRQGPVLRNGVVPRDVRAPEVRLGGRATVVETSMTDSSNLSMRAGVLSLGVRVQQDEGSVSQSDDGTTEIAVRKGAKANISGEGFRPESTVQVFLPLEGRNAKELTRIPVAADGSFDGDAVFATRPDEDPLPVGRQVLQLVSIDEDGNEAVVDMTVNIAQPSPAPEANRVEGVIPTLTPGSSIATNAGVPEEVRVSAVEEQNLAVVEGDGWSMAIGVVAEDGGVQATDGGASLTLVRNETARVSGDGFMPGTRADVWLFSEPTLLGTVTIDDEGRFDGEVNIDGRVIAVGNHTLQLQGVGEDGYVRAANMGVTVGEPAEIVATAEENSLMFIWWVLAALVLMALVTVFWIAANRRRSA